MIHPLKAAHHCLEMGTINCCCRNESVIIDEHDERQPLNPPRSPPHSLPARDPAADRLADNIDAARLLIGEGSRYEDIEVDTEGAPTGKRWYHGRITDEAADARLRAATADGSDSDGTYLVYDNPRREGGFILLVYHRGELHRWRITRRRSDNMYILGRDWPDVKGFKTVDKLIHHHRGVTGVPINLERGGLVTLTKAYVLNEAP